LINPQDKVKMAELINKYYEMVEKDNGTVTLTITAKGGKIVGRGIEINNAW
jgi:uncharacterized Fe-S cluster-containing protein